MDREKDIRTVSDNAGTGVSFYSRGPGDRAYVSDTVDASQVKDIAYKKTSRLLQGVFLVTDGVDDMNVLKKELRTEMITLLSLVVECGGVKEMLGEVRIRKSQLKLRALLSTAGITQLIRKEYVAMLQDALTDLEGEYGVATQPQALKDVLFESDKQISNVASYKQPTPRSTASALTKGHVQSVTTTSAADRISVEPVAPKKHLERREVILNLIRDKQRVTVKDAQVIVTGVSSKTLQRELLAMVAEGVLKREGERRWSVYMLRTNGNGNGVASNSHVSGAMS